MEDKLQKLTDKLVGIAMSERYGKRYDKCDNVEDDAEMNATYTYLDEMFYFALSEAFQPVDVG